jgi:hypothetical protein
VDQPQTHAPEAADTQLAMLTELVRHIQPDSRGFIPLRRDDLIDALEQIRHEHKLEMQALPNIAGRLVGVLGAAA